MEGMGRAFAFPADQGSVDTVNSLSLCVNNAVTE